VIPLIHVLGADDEETKPTGAIVALRVDHIERHFWPANCNGRFDQIDRGVFVVSNKIATAHALQLSDSAYKVRIALTVSLVP